MIILCSRADRSCGADQLREIAGLIYDTDPYIYPAMFSSREEAQAIIPQMIAAGDAMFQTDNLFVAYRDGSVAGLILWKQGPMRWDPEIYVRCGGSSPWMDRVCREYFAQYAQVDPSVISLINICVGERFRGQGVGRAMLSAFLRGHRAEMELYVLADNAPAIRLYRQQGFQVTETVCGFSVDGRDLPCYRMIRLPDVQAAGSPADG